MPREGVLGKLPPRDCTGDVCITNGVASGCQIKSLKGKFRAGEQGNRQGLPTSQAVTTDQALQLQPPQGPPYGQSGNPATGCEFGQDADQKLVLNSRNRLLCHRGLMVSAQTHKSTPNAKGCTPTGLLHIRPQPQENHILDMNEDVGNTEPLCPEHLHILLTSPHHPEHLCVPFGSPHCPKHLHVSITSPHCPEQGQTKAEDRNYPAKM